MLTDSIAFSSFSVKDLVLAKRFYSEILGLEVGTRPEGLEIKWPNRTQIFVYPSTTNKPADYTILNFIVGDIESVVDDLHKKGVQFEQYDMPYMKTNERGVAEQGGRKMAWFKDPSGNILSLLQEK
jgi:catechol 2,3-dioxygenase-like lactoylglutathione lyase family enzyme